MSHERDQLRAAWKITTAGRHDTRDFLTSVQALADRAERAEATIARVQALADRRRTPIHPVTLRAALDGEDAR